MQGKKSGDKNNTYCILGHFDVNVFKKKNKLDCIILACSASRKSENRILVVSIPLSPSFKPSYR